MHRFFLGVFKSRNITFSAECYSPGELHRLACSSISINLGYIVAKEAVTYFFRHHPPVFAKAFLASLQMLRILANQGTPTARPGVCCSK